ncbi:MAG: tyrosine-type recombinase/integrase [Limnoraphis sp. WC205]|nr:tyrosine-type recombinase/integrase [Limnoraphis sp. WC205]
MAKHHTVSISDNRGRVRLRWTYQGQRYSLNLGLPYTPTYLKVASMTAHRIELDIESGNFDETLDKYRPEHLRSDANQEKVTVVELFERFIKFKEDFVDKRTLEKYYACMNYIDEFVGSRSLNQIDEKLALKFSGWLQDNQQLSPRTTKEHLSLLKAAFAYGMKNKLVGGNPWTEVVSYFKVPPKQMPDPFTLDEVRAIIEAFRNHSVYSYYYPYVEFLFRTGCRTAEAIGLQWKNLNPNCTSVWIGESLSRGRRKATKTNRARTIPLSDRLSELLLSIRRVPMVKEELVFLTPKRKPIDDGNFRSRAWQPILQDLGIEYRKPYITRHTFISHALASGMNPMEVAQITGHDLQTLYDNYAGYVNKTPQLFDF